MSLRRSAPTAAVFVALAGAATWLWEQSGRQVSDVTLYRVYGERMAHGLVPYRDFDVEYPPGALPVFWLPALFTESRTGYAIALAVVLAAAGAAGVVLCERAGAAVRGRVLVALSPIALGALLLTRYDLVPAALTVAALLALLAGRERAGGLLLGVAIAVKLYPVVLLPLAAVWAYRRRGAVEARWVVGLALGIPALAYLPFVLLAPDGVAWSIGHQLSRPLQIESLGASLLLTADHLGGIGLSWSSGHGSQNLDGAAAATIATLSSIAQVAVLVALWVGFARGQASAERLVRFSAAAIVAFVVLGKVLSPQYLIWPLFIVPLVAGLRGARALVLYAAAMILTALWFPARYWQLVKEFDPLASTFLVARNLALVGLLVVLVGRVTRTSPAPADAAG